MSDKGSQHGSIRAGYRRSRMEPVDPGTITAPPPNAPSPNSQTRPPSTGPKKDDEKKEGIIIKIVRFLFLFFNILLLGFGIMLIITGVVLWIVFRDAGLSFFDVLEGTPFALILNGCLLSMVAMWGCEIAFLPNRKKTTLYMISLLIIYGFSIFSYIRSNRIADSIGENLTTHWGTFSATTRSNIQDFGYCCGLHGPIDYPALPCPQGARTGCYEAIMDMQSTIYSASNGFLGGSTFIHLFLVIAAFVLGRPKKEKNPTDVESNAAAGASSAKEDLNKAEVHSQI